MHQTHDHIGRRILLVANETHTAAVRRLQACVEALSCAGLDVEDLIGDADPLRAVEAHCVSPWTPPERGGPRPIYDRSRQMPASTRYVALLRGINLGARNKLAMGDLRAVVESLGGTDVETYVQSGNVVFGSTASAGRLETALAEELRTVHTLEVPVLVRSSAELDALVKRNPFARTGADTASLHATFLADEPKRALVEALDAVESPPDELRIVGREVYLLCPNGYGRSKLSNAFFEKRLGEVATTRNWRTVLALAELAGR